MSQCHPRHIILSEEELGAALPTNSNPAHRLTPMGGIAVYNLDSLEYLEPLEKLELLEYLELLESLQEAVEFTLVVAFTHGGALVILVLTAAEGDVDLCASVVVDEEAQGHDGETR